MKNKLLIIITALFSPFFTLAQDEDKTFPLVVAFVSHCCGVPDNTPVIDYVKCFKKKYKTNTINAYKIGPAGKEGEYYLAFPLNELNKTQEACFIEGIEKVTIKKDDKGGIIYERDFIIESSRFNKPIISAENLIKI